jgi:hypothetical protein
MTIESSITKFRDSKATSLLLRGPGHVSQIGNYSNGASPVAQVTINVNILFLYSSIIFISIAPIESMVHYKHPDIPSSGIEADDPAKNGPIQQLAIFEPVSLRVTQSNFRGK